MNQLEEKKLLAQVLRRLESQPQNFLTKRWFLPVAWIASVLALVVVFQLGERFGDLVLAIGFTFFGLVVGFATFARVCARQEPVMRPHIDRKSIARRLAELEA